MKREVFNFLFAQLRCHIGLNMLGNMKKRGHPFLHKTVGPTGILRGGERLLKLGGDMGFAGGLGEHAGGDHAEMFKGLRPAMNIELTFVQFIESEDVTQNSVVCGFAGNHGNHLDAVAGVQNHKFVYAPKLHQHKSGVLQTMSRHMEGFPLF